MGRRRRVQTKESIYFITNRCDRGECILTPNLDGKIGENFLECLATTQERYGVRVYGYVLMSNHYHMLVQAPHLNLSPFMRDLQSPFTKRVNRLRERRGSLFPERFSCEEITDGLSLFKDKKYKGGKREGKEVFMVPTAVGIAQTRRSCPSTSRREASQLPPKM